MLVPFGADDWSVWKLSRYSICVDLLMDVPLGCSFQEFSEIPWPFSQGTMQDAQAHTRFQQLQRGRELTAAESSKVQSRVMDSLGQKPADFSKGQSMSGSGSVQPLGSASQCESSRDNVCKMDGHTPTKLPLDTCFNFLSIVHVKKCYSPHLSSITEKNKKLSYLVVHRHRLPNFTRAKEHYVEKEKWYSFTIIAFLIGAGILSLWIYTANHGSSGSRSDTVTRRPPSHARGGGRSLKT